MENYIQTPSHTINHKSLLKLRNLTNFQINKLIEIYGSCIYEVLMRVDLLSFEMNDDYELFLKHNYNLFNDCEFDQLVNDFESTSETDDNGSTYETQVLPD
jgi:hypothetical protein